MGGFTLQALGGICSRRRNVQARVIEFSRLAGCWERGHGGCRVWRFYRLELEDAVAMVGLSAGVDIADVYRAEIRESAFRDGQSCRGRSKYDTFVKAWTYEARDRLYYTIRTPVC